MYLDGSVLTGAALRLLQLLLNPFITAGLQSAAYPNNGLPYQPLAAQPLVAQPMAAVAPPRQFGGADFLSLLAALGAANPAGSFSSTGSLGNGGPMGSFQSSGSLGSSGSPMGSFMSSGSGSLGANGNPMGTFMASGSGSLGANGNAVAAFPGTGALGAMQAVPAASLMPGSMTAASMPAMPPVQIAPWVVSQPLAAVPNAPNGPVFVPPSAVPSLVPPPASSAAPSTPSSTSAGSLAAGALSVLEEAIAPYLNASSLSSSSTSTSLPSISSVLGTDTASPMPMGGLISVLGSFASGIRVVVVNFAASVAVMAGARLLRLVVENLPIILNVVGLTRASMARVIVEGVTRAQCLERAACVLGQHASTYPSTPEVLRWLRSPDPSAAVAPEHPVWRAFRAAAEGTFTQCEAFSC